MFRNYLISAVRNLAKHKLYTTINIFGLTIGLALCLIIIGNIAYELSFEDCHENRQQIYRVNGHYRYEDEQYGTATTLAALGRALQDELLEVENVAIFQVADLNSIEIEEERIPVKDPYRSQAYAHHKTIVFADPAYFDLFTLPVLQGSPAKALNEPGTVFISQSAIDEYFDGISPVGKVITLNDSLACEVRGVLQDIPQNTQLHTDFIASLATLESHGVDFASWDRFGSDYVYLQLSPDADPPFVQSKIAGIAAKHMNADVAGRYTYELQPLKDIYFSSLASGLYNELDPRGEVSVIIAFGLVALFILIQAVANFINLSTARSADRVREVGVRKVYGALRHDLVKQFLGESIIMAVVSMVISILLYEVFKTQIGGLTPREMLINVYQSPLMLAALLGLILLVGVGAGFYPALYLSRFKPVSILQSKSSISSSKSILRRVLVVFQFGLAIVFIVCTIMLSRQISYVTSINLGFDQENILVLDFEGEDAAEKCQLAKNEITARHPVLAATCANYLPGRRSYTFFGYYTTEERVEEDRIVVKSFSTDYDFIDAFGLQVIQGRGFSPEHPEDLNHGIIINRSAVAELGLDDAIGHHLYGSKGDWEIVGVVEDFHGSTLDWGYQSITVISLNPDRATSLALKLPDDDISGTITAIEGTWKEILPGLPFSYTFLDEEIDSNYNQMRGQSKVFLVLALLTIAIACLGIFGLVSFTAEQKTKEIGIRKVLGSSVAGILKNLSREFVILVSIANIVAWPVAYLMVNSFLQQYPFRVSLGPGTFLLAAFLTLALALGTAGYQFYRAASANPIDALRHE